jgi:lipopolysaccharide export system protein LptC
MPRFTLWVVCAVLVAVIVILISGSDEPGTTTNLPDELADSPDLLMVGANILRYRHDGNLSYRLVADQIRHFDKDQVTRLQIAHLHLLDSEGKPPWDIRAGAGEISQRSRADQIVEEVVFLHDEVNMVQVNPDGSFIRLQTPSMFYYPDRQYAETSQNVMIDTDVGRTKASGLQGELQRGLIRLFSSERERVHTIVLRPQFR